MFQNKIPHQTGLYWAQHKTLKIPEIVSFHKYAKNGEWVIRAGDSRLWDTTDFTFGPQVNSPELIQCPACKYDISGDIDFEGRGCSRCQNRKYIWHVEASECYVEKNKR